MQEIVLVRHASATGQEPESPLTAEGSRQAAALADLLLPLKIERVICSPFLRARHSVAPFCARSGISVEVDDRLVERTLSARGLPDWQEHLRRSFDEMEYSLEGGESSHVAQERGVAVVAEAWRSGRRCAVVTHGNLLALILKSIDPTVGFAFWSTLSNPDAFILRGEGDGPSEFSRIVRNT
ncbi:MAG: histidine phosphatase family protein [Gemmatimonadales bacterium]